jgi:hypothetical protein
VHETEIARAGHVAEKARLNAAAQVLKDQRAVKLQEKSALLRQVQMKRKSMPPDDIWAVADYYAANKTPKLDEDDLEDGKVSVQGKMDWLEEFEHGSKWVSPIRIDSSAGCNE